MAEQTKQIKRNQLQTLSELVGRAEFAARLGQQYGTDRDIYEALGYKTTIDYRDYVTRYLRQDIAKAIIDRPVNATWRGPLNVVAPDKEDSPLEKEWNSLRDTLNLKNRFSRLDKLTGIGEYGVLLFGFDDTKNKEGYLQPVAPGNRELRYVKPFGQEDAAVVAYETRTSEKHYGLPTQYRLTVKATDGGDSQLRVHHSRVLHIVDGALESDIDGTPRLEVVFNRLMDLEKLVGGSAEMFWRGARPGYQGKLDKDFKMTETTKEDLQDQIDEYEHKLRRILVNEGLDLEALEQQISNPDKHVDVQLQMISAVTGIPKRILIGSERGELSSSQDKSEWLTVIKGRREEFAEPMIVKPFIDKCMEHGILPSVDEYNVVWEDLFAPSEKEKAEVGKIRAAALKEYATNPAAEMVVPVEMFAKFFLGMSDEEIRLIDEMREQAMREEEESTPEEEETEEQEI